MCACGHLPVYVCTCLKVGVYHMTPPLAITRPYNDVTIQQIILQSVREQSLSAPCMLSCHKHTSLEDVVLHKAQCIGTVTATMTCACACHTHIWRVSHTQEARDTRTRILLSSTTIEQKLFYVQNCQHNAPPTPPLPNTSIRG